MKEKDKNKQKKALQPSRHSPTKRAPECPLCKVSEDTIKKLKEKSAKELKTALTKKSSEKFKTCLLIFVFLAGGFVLY